MKSDQCMFEELLQEYKKQHVDYEQNMKDYRDAYNKWYKEVEMNGDMTEKASELGKMVDNKTSDLDASREKYNFLAHQVLKNYICRKEISDSQDTVFHEPYRRRGR